MNILVSSDEHPDFMEHQNNYDKNAENIIDKDDAWYYSDINYVTNSHLSLLLKGGPQHLKAYYEGEKKETPALIFGRAQHCLMFEPELFSSRFYAIDDREIIAEIGGAKPRGTNKYRDWLQNIREVNEGRTELSFDDMTTIKDMIDRAMSYPQIREIIEMAPKKEVIYSNELKGIRTKCKVDAINPSNYIVDLKSTKDPATLYNAQYVITKYGYDRQGAFYKDNTGVRSFWIIFIEKTYPYTVSLVELSEDTIDVGRKKYELGLEMFQKHFINNPGAIDQYLEIGMI